MRGLNLPHSPRVSMRYLIAIALLTVACTEPNPAFREDPPTVDIPDQVSPNPLERVEVNLTENPLEPFRLDRIDGVQTTDLHARIGFENGLRSVFLLDFTFALDESRVLGFVFEPCSADNRAHIQDALSPLGGGVITLNVMLSDQPFTGATTSERSLDLYTTAGNASTTQVAWTLVLSGSCP